MIETDMWWEWPADDTIHQEEIDAVMEKIRTDSTWYQFFKDLEYEGGIRINLKAALESRTMKRVVPGSIIYQKVRKDQFDKSIICLDGNLLKLYRLANGEKLGELPIKPNDDPRVNGINSNDLATLTNYDPSFYVEDMNLNLMSLKDYLLNGERHIQVSTGDIVINRTTGQRYMIGAKPNHLKFLINLDTGQVESHANRVSEDKPIPNSRVSIAEMQTLVSNLENYDLVLE